MPRCSISGLVAVCGALTCSALELDASCPDNTLLVDAAASVLLCTTTTVTTSTTSTTTVAPNTTRTSTTTPQARECRIYCAANSHPWFIKCNWATCSTCLDCNNVVIPTGEPPTTPAPPPTQARTEATTTLEPTVTATTITTLAATTTVDSRRRRSTTTTHRLEHATCLSGCWNAWAAMYPWSTICTWAVCSECIECFPSTATSTDTSTSTSSTATNTSTTETETTLTSTSTTSRTTTTRTTSEGETTTITTTGTVTTRTTTTTTTITTTRSTTTRTTTGVACTPPSLLLPITQCRGSLAAGRQCNARTLAHACVDQSELVLACPVNNSLAREPLLLSGVYGVYCQICGVAEFSLTDLDARPGYISSTVLFGPNTLGGVVNETGIVGYEVFHTDACGLRTGESLGYVERAANTPGSCCQHDTYSVSVELELEFNTSGAVLTILPKTAAGLLPVGMLTQMIMDSTSAGLPGTIPDRAVPGSQGASSVAVASLLLWLGLWLLEGHLAASERSGRGCGN